MMKYLNKGLLYQWFNAAKVPVLIGLITWGFIAHSILVDRVAYLRNEIGSANSNGFQAVDLSNYFILSFIFLGIYVFANGVSKRNTTMFLCSGPYTKKQIKINELICLMITLGLFIIMYLYIAVTIYVKNNEFMSIVNGYPQIILIEVTRLLLFGTIGILLMLIIDLLFVNTIIAYFGMIAIAIATICIFGKCADILDYFKIYGKIMESIFGGVVHDGMRHINNILFSQGSFNNNQLGMIFRGIIFLMVIIGVMLFVFNVLEKRAKLEAASKIFSSKANEKFIVVYLSLGIGAFINIIISQIFFDEMYMIRRSEAILNSDVVKMLAIDITSIAIIAFISYKILNKILKTIG